ncbi:MAG: PPC domain-containing DNA-binding protein [Terracidiphilus sp.]
MKMRFKWLAFLVFVVAASSAFSQQTWRTMPNPSHDSKDDAKANSDAVPDVYALRGNFDKVLVLRFKYKTDLLAGLEKMVRQEHIQNGVILSAIGSVRSYQLHQVTNREFPSEDTFEKNKSGAADLVSMNGYIIRGRVHAHITLATPDKAIAGHLEPGTEVFTFAIVTIGVMNGTDLDKIDDKTYR